MNTISVKKFHFVGPDLNQKCLQKLSADDTSRQMVECARSMLQKKTNFSLFVFYLILCAPVNNFSTMSGRVTGLPGLNQLSKD